MSVKIGRKTIGGSETDRLKNQIKPATKKPETHEELDKRVEANPWFQKELAKEGDFFKNRWARTDSPFHKAVEDYVGNGYADRGESKSYNLPPLNRFAKNTQLTLYANQEQQKRKTQANKSTMELIADNANVWADGIESGAKNLLNKAENLLNVGTNWETWLMVGGAALAAVIVLK